MRNTVFLIHFNQIELKNTTGYVDKDVLGLSPVFSLPDVTPEMFPVDFAHTYLDILDQATTQFFQFDKKRKSKLLGKPILSKVQKEDIFSILRFLPNDKNTTKIVNLNKLKSFHMVF